MKKEKKYLRLRGEGEYTTCLICGNLVELTEEGVLNHQNYLDHVPLWEEKEPLTEEEIFFLDIDEDDKPTLH